MYLCFLEKSPKLRIFRIIFVAVNELIILPNFFKKIKLDIYIHKLMT